MDERLALRTDDRLRAQAARLADGVAAVVERERVLHAEAHAELAAEDIVGDDDPRFDQHLPYRRIDLADDLAHLLEPRRRILHEQDVRPRVDERDTALRDDRALSPRGRPSARRRVRTAAGGST
jgi:hypothetical protein